jgi:hypothetical protein
MILLSLQTNFLYPHLHSMLLLRILHLLILLLDRPLLWGVLFVWLLNVMLGVMRDMSMNEGVRRMNIILG